MIDIEVLIEDVKKYEFLYDISHRDYKNPSLKSETWEVIAKDLNTTSDACRLKWRTVRDSYIKYKRQLKNSDGTKEIDYIWREHLKFLDNHNVNRKSYYRSVRKQKSDTESRVSNESTYGILSSPSPLAPMGPFSMGEVSPTVQSSQDLRTNVEIPKVNLMDIDATDYLFLSYSGTFKKFPPRRQAFMKVQLAKFFASAEVQQLNDAEQLDDAEQYTIEASNLIPQLPVIVKTEYAGEDI